ncbi:hypothetical protein D3C81_2219240 [compost metagenome]
MAVQLAERFLLADEISLGTFGDRHNNYKAKRQGNYGDQSQPRADRQHHDDNADNCHDRRNQLG